MSLSTHAYRITARHWNTSSPWRTFGKQFQRAVQITLGETLAEVFDPGRELSMMQKKGEKVVPSGMVCKM
jgi:hypothetical protein